MIRVYLAVVDVIPAALVLVPLFLILYATAYKHNLRKTVLYCLFCLYLSAVFSLVGIPNVMYFRPGLKLNLIPFYGIVNDLKNSFLNVILFLPLGFSLPLLWERFRKMTSAAWFGFALSLTIELLQMLTFRATDVNDLITNGAGTVMGFLLAKPFCRKNTAVGEGSREPYVLCALSFGIMFFLHPILSPMLWDRIL